MTSGGLAAKVGTSRVTISRLENGTKPRVSFEVVTRIADALGVSLDFLAGRKEETKKNWPPPWNWLEPDTTTAVAPTGHPPVG